MTGAVVTARTVTMTKGAAATEGAAMMTMSSAPTRTTSGSAETRNKANGVDTTTNATTGVATLTTDGADCDDEDGNGGGGDGGDGDDGVATIPKMATGALTMMTGWRGVIKGAFLTTQAR